MTGSVVHMCLCWFTTGRIRVLLVQNYEWRKNLIIGNCNIWTQSRKDENIIFLFSYILSKIHSILLEHYSFDFHIIENDAVLFEST